MLIVRNILANAKTTKQARLACHVLTYTQVVEAQGAELAVLVENGSLRGSLEGIAGLCSITKGGHGSLSPLPHRLSPYTTAVNDRFHRYPLAAH